MRLFIGTFVRGIITKEVYSGIKKDFDGVADGKWVEPENIHFTYKFLGETDKDTAEQVLYDLKDLLTVYHEEIIIRGLDAFPNANRPKILHAGIVRNKILADLNFRIERKTFELGFDPEEKRFNPHITLLRVKESDKNNFGSVLSKYRYHEFGRLTSFNISLIESRLAPEGPSYRIVESL